MSPDDDAAPARPRVGGMALANGLLVHGPRCWAVAVRSADGEIHVTSGAKVRVPAFLSHIPVVRGAARLAEALAVVPVSRMRSPRARLAIEEPAAAGVLGLTAVGVSLWRRRIRSPLRQELLSAVSGVLPAVALLSRSDAASWHAVEHKSIAAYEDLGPAGVADAATYAKEHPRCGSNLVLPLVACSLAANVAMRHLTRGRLANRASAAVLSAGVAVEAFAFAGRRPAHPLSRAVHGAGHALQARWVTREPSHRDLDVGRRAMEELLRLERIARIAG